MRPSFRKLVPLSIAALLAVAACHRPMGRARTAATPPPATRPTATVASTSGPGRVSQANVIAIVLAANNTDLSYARLVPARASSAEVKAFANRMLTDHTILNTRITDVSTNTRIIAEDNTTSLDFRDRSAARRDVLRELEGAKFDSTYIANEVRYHQELLAAIDQVLLPSTKAGELRDFVTNLRPAVSAHLAHAEQIRATLATRR